ncbi:MAG: hypothetical protein VXW24_07140 [Bacteroidota bacterium]|nr:hypothetical protein [Bacteroidota bacterium]
MHIFQRILPYLIGVLTLLMLSYIVSGPEHEGKVMKGSDTISSIAKRKQIKDFEKETGSPSYWNPAQFGGSPAYLLKFGRENSVLNFFDSGLRMALSQVWYHFFITGLFMYIALCLLRINPWVSLALASAAMLTTNVYILLVTGHFAKVATLAPLPMLIAGVLATFRKDYIAGFAGTFLGLAFAILLLHPQMVYYTVLGLTLTGLVLLIKTGMEKKWVHLGKTVGVLVFAGILGGLANYSHLKSSQDFAKSTMRGGSILKSTTEKGDATSKGLGWDYAMSWSYGNLDLFNLIIPRVVGGSSQEAIAFESGAFKQWSEDYPQVAQSLKTGRLNDAQKNASLNPEVIELPTYWGPMNMSTAGPMYFGAGLWILLVFAVIIAVLHKGRYGLEVLALSLGAFLIILFALGSNAKGFNDFFFNNVPLFDKWRSPSAALAIAAMIFTIISGLGIQRLLDIEDRKSLKPIVIRTAIIGAGLFVVFAALGSEFFKFTTGMQGASEAGYNEPLFVDLRKALMTSDAWRSFMVSIPVLGMLSLLIFQPKRKELTYAFTAVVGLVMVFDLLDVGSRYMTEYNYLEEEALYAQLEPNRNDKAIYAIEGEDNQGFYRVLDLSTNTFNDAIPSAKHYQIGGYDPAKLRRIQDVIESRALFSPEVLGMFNVRHVIQQDGQLLSFDKDAGFRQFVSEPKPVWFVNNIRTVSSPEEEIGALTEASFRHLNTAILNTTDFGTSYTAGSDTAGSVELVEAEPNRLVYKSSSTEDEFAVFSEVWYGGNPDWTVTIDGKDASFIRVNYILRGMEVPAGDHEIVFEFKPKPSGGGITLSASLLGLLLVLGGGGWVFYQEIKEKA